jgi:hypothetical protein
MRAQVEADLRDREAAREKERAAALEAERVRRAPIQVGGQIVAQELRANAEVAERCDAGSHVPTERQRMRVHRLALARARAVPLAA